MSQGKEKAKQYLEANEAAIFNMQEIIEEEQIECEFQKQDAYVFTNQEAELPKIKKEVEVVKDLGFPAEFVTKSELPLSMLGAIKFPNQAQFNPCKYAQGLVRAMKDNVSIFENTKIVDVKSKEKDEVASIENKSNASDKILAKSKINTNQEEEVVVEKNESNKNYNVLAENGKQITAKYVVLATHYPIINIPGYYFLKMYQSLSYVIAVETPKVDFQGMYINSEKPTLSFRMAGEGENRLLLIAGMDHKTGEKRDLSQSYEDLIKVAKQIDPTCKVKYKWCTEDCISLDKIPYIGEFSNLMPNVYVGTGYKKWGMTSSNVAANIIVDKILGKENSYEDVFTSTRLKPIKNRQELGNMVKEVVKSLVVEKLKIPKETLEDLKKEEGKVLEIDSKKVGVYKDETGTIFAIKPVCTHLGCELSWNNLEKTWDCPCHGSRFTYQGKSIYDPSIHDLERIEIE